MVDDLDDLGGVKAVGGLQRLVVVDEDDLLALEKRLDQTRRLDAVLAQDPLGLRRKAAQTACLVDGVGTSALGQLVFQVRIANSCADGIVVGVLVTEHQDGCRHVIAPSLAGSHPAFIVLPFSAKRSQKTRRRPIIIPPLAAHVQNPRELPRTGRKREMQAVFGRSIRHPSVSPTQHRARRPPPCGRPGAEHGSSTCWNR